MTNITDSSELTIDEAKQSFYEFAKKYVCIADGNKARRFTDAELKYLKEIQTMTDQGYELRMMNTRKGSGFEWVKKP